MDCDQFRKNYLVDPNTEDIDTINHKSQCKACNEFANKMDNVEAKIKKAIHIPVPIQLIEKVLQFAHMRSDKPKE